MGGSKKIYERGKGDHMGDLLWKGQADKFCKQCQITKHAKKQEIRKEIKKKVNKEK